MSDLTNAELVERVKNTLLVLSGHLPFFSDDKRKVKRAEEHQRLRDAAYDDADEFLARLEAVTQERDAAYAVGYRGIEAAERRADALRDELRWLDMALGWAVFRDDSKVYASNEMRTIKDRIREALAADKEPTHGRHCPCTACANEDWTRITGPCGIHGASCPAVYAPLAADKEQA